MPHQNILILSKRHRKQPLSLLSITFDTLQFITLSCFMMIYLPKIQQLTGCWPLSSSEATVKGAVAKRSNQIEKKKWLIKRTRLSVSWYLKRIKVSHLVQIPYTNSNARKSHVDQEHSIESLYASRCPYSALLMFTCVTGQLFSVFFLLLAASLCGFTYYNIYFFFSNFKIWKVAIVHKEDFKC